MNKPSKSQVLYERNMELQKAYAEVSSLTEQRDHWQQQTLSKSELVAALEARCRVLDDALKIAGRIRSKDDANRIAELEAALRKYGGHARNCAHIQGHYKGPSRDCDCDWVNAFPAAMGASTKETPAELPQAPMPCPGFNSGACVPGEYCGVRMGYAYPCPGQPALNRSAK